MSYRKITLLEQSTDVIPISISFEKNILDHLTAKTLEDAQSNSLVILPTIESLSRLAFIEHDTNAWNHIQNLLYYLNYHDITRKNRIDDYTPLVEYAVRKKILEIQALSLPIPTLECESQFTPERAVTEMADKASSHRINHHPLLSHLATHGLSHNALLHFLSNYYVNNRLFHLFIVTLSLFTPLEGRTELANNFYDELGSGDQSMAHPVLFLKNFDTIGRPQEIIPLAEALYLANEKTYAAYLLGDYHYGMGGFGFIELTMPEQMKKILCGLKKSGLPNKDIEFWDLHITIDLEHGKTWFREMLELVKTPQQAKKCLQGGLRLLDARAKMYDGIWHAILLEEKELEPIV